MDVLLANSEGAKDPTVLESSTTRGTAPLPNPGTLAASFTAAAAAASACDAHPAECQPKAPERLAGQHVLPEDVPPVVAPGARASTSAHGAGSLGPANLRPSGGATVVEPPAPPPLRAERAAGAGVDAEDVCQSDRGAGDARASVSGAPDAASTSRDPAGTAAAPDATDFGDRQATGLALVTQYAGDAPVTAMPALDLLDMSVVDTLPAAMRLELMQAYGLHSTGPTPRKKPARAVVGKSAGGSGRKRKATAAAPTAAAAKRAAPAPAAARAAQHAGEPLRDTPSGDAALPDASECPPGKVGPPAATELLPCGGGGPRVAIQGLTLSQIDPGTFQELPEDERQCLVSSLPRSRSAFVAKQEVFDPQATARQQTLVHGLQVPLRSHASAARANGLRMWSTIRVRTVFAMRTQLELTPSVTCLDVCRQIVRAGPGTKGRLLRAGQAALPERTCRICWPIAVTEAPSPWTLTRT